MNDPYPYERQCAQKRPSTFHAHALTTVLRMNDRYAPQEFVAYQCGWCGFHHIGHRDKRNLNQQFTGETP